MLVIQAEHKWRNVCEYDPQKTLLGIFVFQFFFPSELYGQCPDFAPVRGLLMILLGTFTEWSVKVLQVWVCFFQVKDFVAQRTSYSLKDMYVKACDR